MAEYLNMWKNYTNFSDRTTKRGYWMMVLVGFIVTSILTYLDGRLGFGGYSYTNTGSSFYISSSMGVLSGIYSLASFIPGLAITVRRLRDAGQSWKNFFWILLPLIGLIVFIVKLCKDSIPDDGTAVV